MRRPAPLKRRSLEYARLVQDFAGAWDIEINVTPHSVRECVLLANWILRAAAWIKEQGLKK